MLSVFLSFESVVWGIPLGLVMFLVVFYMGFNKVQYWRLVGGMISQFSVRFSPFSILGVFLFYYILVMNTLALVPMGLSVSALGAITLTWAFIFWSSNFLYCLKEKFTLNVAHFLPVGTPSFLVVLLVWIEVVSWLARPLALSVRLMANITAGHLLLHLLSESVEFMTSMGVLVIFSLISFSFMVVLEVAVAFIQAYVFSLLLSLYMSESLGN